MPASPPNSQRGKIRQNLKRQLQTILVSNGYSRNVKMVDSNIKTWEQLGATETPAIFPIGEDVPYQYNPSSLIQKDWKFSLYIVIKETSSGVSAVPEDMDEFLADVEQCLMANQTLYFSDTGGVCSYIRVRHIITDDGFFLNSDGSNIAKMTISIVYNSCVGARS